MTPDRPPLSRRLALAALALFLFITTINLGNFFLPDAKRVTGDMVGHDFLAFYTAGRFVREGRPHDLYDLAKVKSFQHDLARRERLGIRDSYGPFWNPPFYALVFVPLAALSYPAALFAWELANLACLFAAILLLIHLLPPPTPWRVRLLVPLLVCTGMPFIQALTHGQNTFGSLLLLTITIALWRSQRPLAAGLVAGLLLYKPQLGAVVALALACTMGWRAVLGLAITGAALLALTLLALPGSIHDYLANMPGNLRQFQVVQEYLWNRHVTLRAFWRLLLQGPAAGEMTIVAKFAWLTTWSLLAGGLTWAWWRSRQDASRRDAFIAAVIPAMPLLMPFYFDYDLLLVATSAVLYAATCLRGQSADRWLTRGWIALFCWLMVNTTVARYTNVNGTVILLSFVTACSIWRAGRPIRGEHADARDGFTAAALAAAA
ncbi:MAG TPA: glycosyltransferase family 87 protein [Tepidisphaeraceae bacterium]